MWQTACVLAYRARLTAKRAARFVRAHFFTHAALHARRAARVRVSQHADLRGALQYSYVDAMRRVSIFCSGSGGCWKHDREHRLIGGKNEGAWRRALSSSVNGGWTIMLWPHHELVACGRTLSSLREHRCLSLVGDMSFDGAGTTGIRRDDRTDVKHQSLIWWHRRSLRIAWYRLNQNARLHALRRRLLQLHRNVL